MRVTVRVALTVSTYRQHLLRRQLLVHRQAVVVRCVTTKPHSLTISEQARRSDLYPPKQSQPGKRRLRAASPQRPNCRLRHQVQRPSLPRLVSAADRRVRRASLHLRRFHRPRLNRNLRDEPHDHRNHQTSCCWSRSRRWAEELVRRRCLWQHRAQQANRLVPIVEKTSLDLRPGVRLKMNGLNS